MLFECWQWIKFIAGAFEKVLHANPGRECYTNSMHVESTVHFIASSQVTNHNLQAIVDGATSQAFPVTAGVPQGRFPGPTVHVYINAPYVPPVDRVPAT